MNTLQGSCAFVTGAGKGIGRAITLALLKEGVNVTGISRTRTDLESLSKESGSLSGEFKAIPGDISNEHVIKESIEEAVNYFSRLDHLINNAGIGIMKPVQEMSVEEWDLTMNINTRGAFLATRFALPYMIRNNSGTIINIASIARKRAFAGGAAYCASKFAMMGFSEALMFDVRKYNIRVITICPGTVATKFHTGEALKKDKDRVLTPEDCAETVVYALKLLQSAAAHEIELRITNP